MKNYKKALVAGGAGLLLGLGSIATYGSVVENATGVSLEQELAESLSNACSIMKKPSVFVEYIDAVSTVIGDDFKQLYCYVEGAASSYGNRCPNTAGSGNNHAVEVSGNQIETALRSIESQVDTVVGSCTATVCQSKIFEATIAESANTSSFNQALTGGKADGDIALICTLGTCDQAALSGTKFLILPHSIRKSTMDGKYTTLQTRDSGKPISYDFAVIYKNSGTTGLTEEGAEAVSDFMAAPSRCNNTALNTLHDVRINGTTAGSPFAGGEVHWVNY